jgi:2-polyprenyl-6-methoxyphenol hydroxylase-like FAD-dependent oxidoreductase
VVFNNFRSVYSIFAMRVLISGAGIAGPALAYWLAHHGLEPTIVEKAPKLRTAGYIIDFWGLGFDVADRMGLLPEIRRKGYMVREVRIVDRTGKRIAGFPAEAVARIAKGRYISLARGDLAASIFGAIEGKVESIFNNSVARIEHTAQVVQVTFETGTVRGFDLVVGADGLHSRVRGLVFGPQADSRSIWGTRSLPSKCMATGQEMSRSTLCTRKWVSK